MEIEKIYDMGGFKFKATIKSLDLNTHSRMGILDSDDRDAVKLSMQFLLDNLAGKIISAEERKE